MARIEAALITFGEVAWLLVLILGGGLYFLAVSRFRFGRDHRHGEYRGGRRRDSCKGTWRNILDVDDSDCRYRDQVFYLYAGRDI